MIPKAGSRLQGALTGILLACVLGTPALGQAPAAKPSAEEAQAIASEAYIYFYPLVTMDFTRKQLINSPPGSGIGGPMNTFVNIPTFPAADMKAVVRPNFDTLYSSAWLDLTKELIVVSVPDTGGRYYLLPMLDMWTNVFAAPGWRTTGTQLPYRSAGLERAGAGQFHAHRCPHAIHMDHRPHQD